MTEYPDFHGDMPLSHYQVKENSCKCSEKKECNCKNCTCGKKSQDNNCSCGDKCKK